MIPGHGLKAVPFVVDTGFTDSYRLRWPNNHHHIWLKKWIDPTRRRRWRFRLDNHSSNTRSKKRRRKLRLRLRLRLRRRRRRRRLRLRRRRRKLRIRLRLSNHRYIRLTKSLGVEQNVAAHIEVEVPSFDRWLHCIQTRPKGKPLLTAGVLE